MMEWMRKHDILTRLLSLMAAMTLWLYVVESRNEDVEQAYKNIGVQIQGLDVLRDNGMTVIEGADTKVNVTVVGKRDALLNVRQDKFLATVDVSNIPSPGEYNLQYTVSANTEGARISDKNPRLITLKIDRMTNKSVPVRLKVIGQPPEGYSLAGDCLVSPTAVEIQGPEADLAKIEYAYVEVDVSELRQTATQRAAYTLMTAEDQPADTSRITSEDPAVDVTTPVYKAGSAPLVLDLILPEGLPEGLVSYVIEPSSVEIKGDSDALAAVNSIELGSVNLAALLEQGTDQAVMPLILPNGLTSDSAPSEAVIRFDLSRLGDKTIRVDSSQFTGQPGFAYVTEALDVRVVGTEQAVAELDAQDFTVSFDSQGLGDGQTSVTASVSCSDKNVTIIGRYQVTVEAAEPEEPNEPSEPDGSEAPPAP